MVAPHEREMVVVFFSMICTSSRYGREARQRVAVERGGLPRRAIPRAVLIADDLDGHDDAAATEFVRSGDAVIYESISTRRELDRPREMIVPLSL
jgi:hypothetical protein